ncbi:MAG: zinc-ribbon domain-containing protein [Oscillospiraceae bacterium]|nr:zinc-ribbon domain-containing protein [Oscillospiraceae bacterium]
MAEQKCKKCGKTIENGYTFCLHCGAKVEKTSEEVAAAIPKEDKTAASSRKMQMAIIGGIALVGVIVLVGLIGALKNYNKPKAEPVPELPAAEAFLPEEEQPEETQNRQEEEPQPEPQAVEVDPNSVIIPDFGEFFLKKRLYEKSHGEVGYKYDLINFPEAALEGVREEIFSLLSDPKYQLDLEWEDSYYFEEEGTTSYYYYFTYTGSNPNIGEVYISESKDPYIFQLTIYDMWAEDGTFDIGFFFNENFEEVKAGEHTQQDVGEQIEYADSPQPQNGTVDSNSVIIPDFADYFWSKRSFEGGYGDVGYKYELKNFSDDIREEIMEEVFALLEDPQYQLEFDWVDEYYFEDGTGESHRYHYVYTGTNPSITEVTHPNRIHPFEFVLCFYDTSYTDGIFSLGFQFNKNFEEVKTGKHTAQPVEKDFDDSSSGSNSGGVPDVSGTYDHTPPASKLKCLTCKGDGDCNTCGGSGYKRIGGAKAGCTTCRGNGKCRTCHGSGTR